MLFLADDCNGMSVYIVAKSWKEAELLCDASGNMLVGEYIEGIEISDSELDSITERLGSEQQ